jgi:hypothetical protein
MITRAHRAKTESTYPTADEVHTHILGFTVSCYVMSTPESFFMYIHRPISCWRQLFSSAASPFPPLLTRPPPSPPSAFLLLLSYAQSIVCSVKEGGGGGRRRNSEGKDKGGGREDVLHLRMRRHSSLNRQKQNKSTIKLGERGEGKL